MIKVVEEITERNIKGLKNELYCQYFFTSIGYNVSVPLGEDCKYDLIVDFGGHLTRIQVKTCREEKSGIIFSISSSSLKAGGKSVKRSYTKNDIDYFATVYNEQVYLIPIEICGKGEKKLLFNEPNRFNSESILLQNYKAENQIAKIIENDTVDTKSYILQMDDKDNIIQKFTSAADAIKSIGKTKRDAAHITECCRGRRKSAFGYKWKYSKSLI